MSESIAIKKLQKFINSEENRKLTPQEEIRKIQSIKAIMIEDVREAMKQAIKEKDSAMVAAIAEILKSI